MARTENRPIATGRVTNQGAIVFSGVTGIVGFAVLWLFVNPLTAWLNFASWVGLWLYLHDVFKAATPQNIVIGGLFGAAPPLFGWTAVSNSIDPGGLLLVLIIFVWTPPHFWALAIERKEEYALVNMPMLPVTHGESFTRLHILLYTILLLVCSLLALPYWHVRTTVLAGRVVTGTGVFILGSGFRCATKIPVLPWLHLSTRSCTWAFCFRFCWATTT